MPNNDFSATADVPTQRMRTIAIMTALLCLPRSLHGEPPITYGPGIQLGRLDRKINESSGIAVSRRHVDVLWTHNDSGDKPRLYAIDMQGQTINECRVRGTRSIDWEDIASCQFGESPYLLVGDFGDNGQKRESVQLHLIPEPEPTENEVSIERTITFTYENGSNDCECVAVDPTQRLVLLVAKDWKPICEVFALEIPPENDHTPQIAKRLATLKLMGATGMDISPDGRRAVIVTYGNAYEFHRDEGETWKIAFSRDGREIEMPMRKQGESICYGRDGETLFATSEKSPAPLFKIPPVVAPNVSANGDK